MSKKCSFLLRILSFLFVLSLYSADSFSVEFHSLQVRDINVKILKDITRITVTADKPIVYYETDEFEEPYTLIISIPEATLSFSDEPHMIMPLKTPYVSEVRLHQLYDRLAYPPRILRIIIECKQKPEYTIDTTANNITMNIDIGASKALSPQKDKEKISQEVSTEKYQARIGEAKEKIFEDSLKQAQEKELRVMLEEEKKERLLAKEAQRVKEEARQRELKQLKNDLQKAIQQERYEEAARLRDTIKKLEKKEMLEEAPLKEAPQPIEKRQPSRAGEALSRPLRKESQIDALKQRQREAAKEKALEKALQDTMREEEEKTFPEAQEDTREEEQIVPEEEVPQEEYAPPPDQEHSSAMEEELLRLQKQEEVSREPIEEVVQPSFKEEPEKKSARKKIEEKPQEEPVKKESGKTKGIEQKPPTVEELLRKGEEESKIVGAAPKKEEKKPKKKIATLQECIDIGLENHLPAKIALDEVKLAELKLTEAKRALFPSAQYRINQTEGDIYDIGFMEREYTLKMEQPLYYGGRLGDAVKKAQLNLEIAKRNYNKVKSDLIEKIEANFYSFVGAQMVVAAQEELKAEAEHILGIAKRRFDMAMSTEVEYLNLQNLYAQILYQINAAQMEMGSAKVQLEHTLDLDPSYEIEIKEPLQYAKIDIDLDKSLALAYQNRTELFISELTVRVNELEEKITKNKNRFKIDFTGSYGEGGGAYESESLTLGNTWYAGFLFTKPLGGNTISYNFTKDATAPKLGQSSRTGSQSHIWEFNLLNNIGRYSEEKSAQINLKKSISDLNEMKKTVSSEVRETFFRYEKAIMQVDGATIKIQLRQKSIEVNQTKVDLDEALLSELLESKIKLTDEKVAYLNAINSYYSAISSINKAIGLVGFYQVETPPQEVAVPGGKK
ncbi:MAG: TolC family protein [Candidatus Omnitrophota bacterium]